MAGLSQHLGSGNQVYSKFEHLLSPRASLPQTIEVARMRLEISLSREQDAFAEEMHMESGYVYILCNDRKNVLYVGATSNLKKRLYHHKRRLIAGFTRKYNVHRLVYFEGHDDIAMARCRERQIKGLRREKKESLISGMNPSWRDLYEHLDMSRITKSG